LAVYLLYFQRFILTSKYACPGGGKTGGEGGGMAIGTILCIVLSIAY